MTVFLNDFQGKEREYQLSVKNSIGTILTTLLLLFLKPAKKGLHLISVQVK